MTTNLYTGKINTNGSYATLSSKTSLTFTEGNKYSIQILGLAWLREGTTGEGFMVQDARPIEYKCGADDLYIKASNAKVNIAG